MKQLLIMILMLLICFTSFSQESPSNFSLEEAIKYALENNRTAINAQLDIEAAEKQKWETKATGLPQISAKIDYQNFLKQQISLIPAEFFGGAVGDFAEVAFGTKQNINATAKLDQLIFDGSYLVGLQSAKVFIEISKNAKEKTDLEIRKSVINAYGNVLLSEESVKITENNKIVLEKNLNETLKIYENGLTEEENVEQLQITLLQLENNLNNAIRLREIAYKMLNITMGFELSKNITLTDNLEILASQNIKLELLDANDDVENNIDFRIATNDKKSKELLLKLEKSKALPKLSAFINGSYIGNNNEFDFFKNNQQWFGSSLIGVSLDIPIFSSLGRSAASQRAKINLKKAENQLTETEQQLKFQVASAKSNYQYAIESYRTNKQNLALAERIEKKNQTKFFEGISSSFDLRQAQTQLYTAQQEYLQAMLNVINNKTTLEIVLNQPSKTNTKL
jgi:outer membrane protein TolC